MRTTICAAGLAAFCVMPLFTIAQEPVPDVNQRLAELEKKVAGMEADRTHELHGTWKDGYFFETPDKEFRLQIGGRLQLDTAFFNADDELEAAKGSFEDGMKFRRARIGLRGTMYNTFDFLVEYDFAGSLAFRSVFMGVHDVPVLGTVRIGHQLEPMGLEELCSNNHISLMERGYNTAFNPAYNTGLLAFNHAMNQHITWAAGIFKDTGTLGDSVSNENFAVTARLTGLPYMSDDSRSYLHLGASVSLRDYDHSDYRIRSRPESIMAPYVVDTGNIPVDGATLIGLESILTLDSFSLQGEWSQATLNPSAGEDGATPAEPSFQAYYVMASYLLTGEYRPYVKKSGLVTRITPNVNATGKSWGLGAWEIAARYNALDLNDAGVDGGFLESYTIGLNWYLNPHARIMWDYVQAKVEDTGNVDIFETRFQVDF